MHGANIKSQQFTREAKRLDSELRSPVLSRMAQNKDQRILRLRKFNENESTIFTHK